MGRLILKANVVWKAGFWGIVFLRCSLPTVRFRVGNKPPAGVGFFFKCIGKDFLHLSCSNRHVGKIIEI